MSPNNAAPAKTSAAHKAVPINAQNRLFPNFMARFFFWLLKQKIPRNGRPPPGILSQSRSLRKKIGDICVIPS
jgi:hypothetical protein